MMVREQLISYSFRYGGEWKKIQKAIHTQEDWGVIMNSGNCVTIIDDAYPDCFKELEFAPWVLFYEGNLELCTRKCCAVIGSRLASANGLKDAKEITNIVKRSYVIVSGLAKGIDAMAHRSALNAHTIGVIGCGLDVIYPKENEALYRAMKEHHLVLSEYPPHTKPLAYHFPWRNRLIAALSEHIIVIEARKRSGTLLTVNEALTLNRMVHCVPHAYGDESGYGCNLLISQGADLLLDEEDISMI